MRAVNIEWNGYSDVSGALLPRDVALPLNVVNQAFDGEGVLDLTQLAALVQIWFLKVYGVRAKRFEFSEFEGRCKK